MSEIPTVLSPGLRAVVDALRGLDDDPLVDVLLESERAIRAAQAQRAAVVAVVEERIAALGYPVQGVADEVALSLGISPRSADHLLGDSLALVRRPLVWEALSEGWIDLPKARLIVEMLADFTEGTGITYGFAAGDDNVAKADALFQGLTEAAGRYPKWNFHKYLLDREGRLVDNYLSITSPRSGTIVKAIEKLL